MKTDDIEEFVSKHGLTVHNQMLALMEEMGELGEAMLRDDASAITEELGDIVFIAFSIAIMYDVDLERITEEIAAENIKKTRSTDGAKVTKDTDDSG